MPDPSLSAEDHRLAMDMPHLLALLQDERWPFPPPRRDANARATPGNPDGFRLEGKTWHTGPWRHATSGIRWVVVAHTHGRLHIVPDLAPAETQTLNALRGPIEGYESCTQNNAGWWVVRAWSPVVELKPDGTAARPLRLLAIEGTEGTEGRALAVALRRQWGHCI